MPKKSRKDSNAGAGKLPIQYTRHFKDVLSERSIPTAFIKRTLAKPEKTEERSDGTKHFLKRISEHGNRWLRVIINVSVVPNKAVTAFFDRRLRGKK
jgi:hypothetical protein